MLRSSVTNQTGCRMRRSPETETTKELSVRFNVLLCWWLVVAVEDNPHDGMDYHSDAGWIKRRNVRKNGPGL